MSQYLNDVRKQLTDISTEEVNDLLQFYEEYIDDAGLTDAEAEAKYGPAKNFARALRLNYLMEQDDKSLNTVGSSRTKDRWRLVWMIILGLFASPILLPLAIGAVAVIVGLLISLVAVIFSIIGAVVAATVLGILSIFMGLWTLFSNPAFGLVELGVGLLFLGLGLLLSPLFVKLGRLLVELFMIFVKWVGRKFSARNQVKL
ncbi:MAG: DUF1700 domain-containing protein [Streptococcaceae bacterium]|jgi:uncharacterized membrane protein|nr:DUF1700 domain-containing protein [Streptococcaceae bacterium]